MNKASSLTQLNNMQKEIAWLQVTSNAWIEQDMFDISSTNALISWNEDVLA